MPFGLRSASNTCVDDITSAFVDYMAVLSNSWEDHLSHWDMLLRTITEAGPTLNLKRFNFGQSQITFVGHV
jgi:hypothetical protein